MLKITLPVSVQPEACHALEDAPRNVCIRADNAAILRLLQQPVEQLRLSIADDDCFVFACTRC